MAANKNESSGKSAANIGIILFETEKEFFNEVKTGIDDATKAYDQNVKATLKGIDYNVNSQLAAIDELVKSGIKGLIITPMDLPAVRDKLNELTKKGIKIVTINSDIEGTERICYVGPDAYKSGTVAGGLMRILTGGSAEMAVITGSNELLGHRERVKGFTDVVTKKPTNITIDAVSDCKDDSYKAYELVQRIVLAQPNIDTFFFAAGGVYGGCKGIQQMTINRKFKVLTFDDFESNRAFLESGIITATICQDCYRQGYQAFTTMAECIVNDVKPETDHIYTDITIKIKECL